ASSGVESLVTMGSYAPKAMAVELIVQLLETLAVTVKFEVADPAKAEPTPIRTTNEAVSPPRRPRYPVRVFTSMPSGLSGIPGRFRACALREVGEGSAGVPECGFR